MILHSGDSSQVLVTRPGVFPAVWVKDCLSGLSIYLIPRDIVIRQPLPKIAMDQGILIAGMSLCYGEIPSPH